MIGIASIEFRTLRRNLALVSGLLAMNLLAATTYYVDAEIGSDSNNGLTAESAWRSLAKVNQTSFGPGDSVLFRRGQTWHGMLRPEASGTADQRVYFGAYGTGTQRPRIHADGQVQAVLLENTPYLTFEGFEITNPAPQPNRDARGIYLVVSRSGGIPGVIIRDNYLHEVIGWVYQNRRYQSAAVMMYSSHLNGWFEDILIENNTIMNVTTRGITARQDSANWQNPATLHRNIVIRGNYIDSTGCDAIRTIAMRDALIEHNVVYRVGAYTMGEEANHIAAMFPQQSIDTVWQFNEVAYTAPTNPPAGQMDSQPFDVDHNCAGTHVFQYNYTYENYGGFFLLMGEMMDDPNVLGRLDAIIVRYNVSVNDGVAFPKLLEIHPFGSKVFDIQFYNNTFHYDTGTMRIQQRGPVGSGLKNLQLRNNIFSAPVGSYPTDVDQTYESNLFWRHSPPSLDKTAVTGDPLFAGPLGGIVEGMAGADRFRLMPGSPAAGAGVAIPGNGHRDFWGNPVADLDPPTIGAHEVQSHPGLIITVSDSEPSGEQYFPFELTFAVMGGTEPYVWSADVVSGYIWPNGLEFIKTAEGAILEGTPSVHGHFRIVVSVSDADDAYAERVIELEILPYIQSVPSIVTGSLPPAPAGESYSVTLQADGGNGKLSWSVSSGSLPPGLSVNADGLISGRPYRDGVHEFTVRVMDEEGDMDERQLSITVSFPPGTALAKRVPAGSVMRSDGIDWSVFEMKHPVVKPVVGSSNNTVTFGVVWDREFLYVAVNVIDAVLVNDSVSFWQDDSVEIFIDGNHNGSVSPTYEEAYDRQFVGRWGDDPPVLWEQRGFIGNSDVFWQTVSGGYKMLFALEFESFGVSPVAGLTIGFDVGNNDDDTGGSRDGQLMWHGTSSNWNSTAHFGTLILGSASGFSQVGEWMMDPSLGYLYGILAEWCYSPLLAFIHTVDFPILFSPMHGWLWHVQSTDSEIWLFSPDLGWCRVPRDGEGRFFTSHGGESWQERSFFSGDQEHP